MERHYSVDYAPDTLLSVIGLMKGSWSGYPSNDDDDE